MRAILLGVLALGLMASIGYGKVAYNDEDHAKEVEQIKEYVANKDIKGLIRIVAAGEIRSKEEAARRLGEMGDRAAIPILKQMDKEYATFECHPSGEFAIAIFKIENKGKTNKEKIKGLLRLAQSRSSDNVQKIGNSVVDLAAIEISKFNDPSAIPELRKLDGYGAVQAVIRLESLGLSQEEEIAKYAEILEKHETPLLAEGAQNLLIEIGEPATLKVVELLSRTSAGKSDTWRGSFNTSATVAVRCIGILEKIGNREALLAIGMKLHDENLYVKTNAVLALQRITGEDFGFDDMDYRVGKDEKANKGIRKAQDWWKENGNVFVGNKNSVSAQAKELPQKLQ